MKTGLKTTFLILLCSSMSAVGAVGLYDYVSTSREKDSLENEWNTSVSETNYNNGGMHTVAYRSEHTPQDFVEVVERSLNSVVNIRAEVELSGRGQIQEILNPFDFLFGAPGFGRPAPREMPKQIGIGSGVIISKDGYIVTNNHVVENATKITVSTHDNQEMEAKIIGTDPTTDLALIKVEAKGLHPLPFGNSEQLKVGEWVLAIGNPFNLSSTVTAGIVSAKGRGAIGSGKLDIASFIQTDAAVNPGNSGGALVNTRGELIGINTMIFSQTGNYAGYSFAIPVSIASKVVADLKQYSTVQRAVLGIQIGDISSKTREEFDLKVSEGAVVGGFGDISAARSAGIEVGDVITKVHGTTVRNTAELQEQISKYRPGDKIQVEVNRKGKNLKYTIELKNQRGNTDIVRSGDTSVLGAAFKSLNKEKRQRLGIEYGVEVAGVDNGKFRQSGISKGFVILTINNVKVSTPDEVERVVREVISTSQDKVLFIKGINPNGRIRYIAVDLND